MMISVTEVGKMAFNFQKEKYSNVSDIKVLRKRTKDQEKVIGTRWFKA